MTLTSRRKRPIDRRTKPAPNRDARLFIIATEGRKPGTDRNCTLKLDCVVENDHEGRI